MQEIKKVKKISVANIFSLTSSLAAFLAVFAFYSYAIILALKAGQTAKPLYKFILFNVSLGLVSSLFAAFLAGLVAWIFGIILAGLYNTMAKKSGGLKIEIDGLPERPEEKKQEELFPF